jgi:hypothetical protein
MLNVITEVSHMVDFSTKLKATFSNGLAEVDYKFLNWSFTI